MKKSYLSLSACALLATFTFVGCGSSSSSSTGTLQLNPYLGNIDYTCGDITSVTSSNGEYTYKAGDTCTFKVGGVELQANGSSHLTISDILNNGKNTNVSKDAIWAYVMAATGKTKSELSNSNSIEISDSFKSATDDIKDFSSFDSFKAKLLADTDVSEEVRNKFNENIASFSFVKTDKKVNFSFK